MGFVIVSGIDRPGLGRALRAHGLTPVATGSGAVAFVADGIQPPAAPVLVEAASLDRAVSLLGAGADDVVLDNDPDALVAARLAALLRRTGATSLGVGDLSIDLVERRATRAGRRLPLLPREYALLVHLARARGAAVSRDELIREVLGLRFDPGTNVVAAHLSRLRAKLHRGFAGPMLMTERNAGYRLVAALAAG